MLKYSELKEKFITKYGDTKKEIHFFTAPGRVNLIGEHTDYNGGYVFPAALSLNTIVAVRPRNDRLIKLSAVDLDLLITASLDNLSNYKNIEWGNYQLGVFDELQKAGYNLCGMEMLFDNSIPFGAGLSSSAAIEVSSAVAAIEISNLVFNTSVPLDKIKIAKITQKAENNYVGVNCGIMDQFASILGKKNHAIFLNCKNLSFNYIPIKLENYKILITNTNKKRGLADSKYNERRNECNRGVEMLKTILPDIKFLSDIDYNTFDKYKSVFTDPIVLKRTIHVLSENNRVIQSTKALESGDLVKFGKLLVESHNSLKTNYEVSGIELDTLVEEALKVDGVLGSRMTGAGFGGCTLSIVHENKIENFKKSVEENYTKKISIKPSFYISDIGDGACKIKL